jgi:ankyrin repeat protein
MPSAADLFNAIEQGEDGTVVEILEKDPGAARARNTEGLSPLVVAAYWGRRSLVPLLARAVGTLDFWEAAIVGATDAAAAMVRSAPELVTARSPDGFTALHLAVFFGQLETARMLIAAGADVTSRTSNAFDNQPLHAAVAGGDWGARLACVRLLLGAGAPPDETQPGGSTPLMSAAQNGDDAVVDLLLASGADPRRQDDAGRTAPAHAAEAGHQALAARLREHPPA